MSTRQQLANLTYRDSLIDGVLSSGVNMPSKSEIRAYENLLNAAIDMALAGQVTAFLPRETVAALNADLAHAAGVYAVVFADATSANNGVYKKIGASGSGSWSQISSFVLGYVSPLAIGSFALVNDPGAAAISITGPVTAPLLNLTLFRGSKIWPAVGAPSNSVGLDGDYAIDTSAFAIWGPKSGGVWGASTGIAAAAATAISKAAEAAASAAEAESWAVLVAGSTSAIRVVKTKAQLQAALPSSGDILIAGTVTIDEPLAVSGVARLWIYGGGKLQFTSAGSITFASCDDLSVDGVKFGGWIAQTDQYSVFKTGVHGDFASPSYNNGASAVDGSDFSHSLVGSMLTLSLGAAFWNALTTRNVVSSMISLDPTKRYVIDIKAGFYSGDGGNGVQFTTYDAGGAEIGEYAPADSSSYYSVISGASGMKVRVGVTSWYNTALDLSCVYDLSKIVIYKIENDLAAFSLATPTEDSSPILISNSKRPIIRDCQFDLIPAAAAIFVGCVDVEASGNTVTRCFGGISATTSTGKTKIVGNKIDLRFGVVGGGSLGQRFLRTHGVQASGSSDVEASRNTINGASWGIEILHYNDAYRHDVVGNTIEAEYCGISGVSGGWTAQFPNIIKSNTVKVSGSAIMGIEAAIGAAQGVRSVIEDNTVLWNDLCQFGAGVALSAGSQNFDVRVRRNTIFAPIGVNATAGIGTMEASKNNIRHAGRGISSFVQASFIDDNEIYTAKNTWLLAAHAAIHISAYTYYIGSEITKNKYDDTISLSGWVEGTAFFDWRGNKIYERYARTGDMTHHRFEVISNPYATKAQYSGNEIMYGSLCPDRVINNLYTGSVFEVSGNKYGGLAHDVLVGFHNASGGRDVGAVAAWNPGAIANGASAISADINILDHRFQIGDPVKVMAPYDLQGCTATAYVKSAASDTLDGSNFITGQTPAVVKIVITNATGGSITFADGTWVVLADNVRR